jgi:hypothetical protein
VSVRFVDELGFAVGWIEEEPIERTSHALVLDDGVWLVDPVDAPDALERVGALGPVRGVVQLLDRHERDSRSLAARLGVPRFEVPFGGVPETPFELVPLLRSRFWREAALWWPERRVLVCADALGTLPYFCAAGEPIGVHPLLRLRPPKRLARFAPRHVLVGHGEGIHGDDAPLAVRDAVEHASRRLPSAILNAIREARRRD